MDGGVTFVAVTIVKLAVALGVCTAVIQAVNYFNTFELKGKGKKKGGYGKHGYDDVEALRSEIRSKY